MYKQLRNYQQRQQIMAIIDPLLVACKTREQMERVLYRFSADDLRRYMVGHGMWARRTKEGRVDQIIAQRFDYPSATAQTPH